MKLPNLISTIDSLRHFWNLQLFMSKAEALLKLHLVKDADSCLSNVPKLDPYTASCSESKFFGMLSEAYTLLVQAQIELALGR